MLFSRYRVRSITGGPSFWSAIPSFATSLLCLSPPPRNLHFGPPPRRAMEYDYDPPTSPVCGRFQLLETHVCWGGQAVPGFAPSRAPPVKLSLQPAGPRVFFLPWKRGAICALTESACAGHPPQQSPAVKAVYHQRSRIPPPPSGSSLPAAPVALQTAPRCPPNIDLALKEMVFDRNRWRSLLTGRHRCACWRPPPSLRATNFPPSKWRRGERLVAAPFAVVIRAWPRPP